MVSDTLCLYIYLRQFIHCYFELGQGLKATIESIDNRSDFKVYMQNYAYAHGGQPSRGPKREGPWEEGFVSAISFLVPSRSNSVGLLGRSVTILH